MWDLVKRLHHAKVFLNWWAEKVLEEHGAKSPMPGLIHFLSRLRVRCHVWFFFRGDSRVWCLFDSLFVSTHESDFKFHLPSGSQESDSMFDSLWVKSESDSIEYSFKHTTRRDALEQDVLGHNWYHTCVLLHSHLLKNRAEENPPGFSRLSTL